MDETETENPRFSAAAADAEEGDEDGDEDYHSLPPSSPAASRPADSDPFGPDPMDAEMSEMSTYYELEPVPVTEADLVEWIEEEMRSMRSEISEEGDDMSVVDWDPPDLDMSGFDVDYSLEEIASILGHGEGDPGGLDWVDMAEFPAFQEIDSPYNSDVFGECFPPNQNQPVMNPEPDPDWDAASTTSSSIPDLEELVQNMELEVLLAMHNIYEGDPEMEMFRHFLELDRAVRTGPATAKSALESLPSVTADKSMADLQCAVCKEFVLVGELVNRLPCSHGYHKSCIVPWLGIRNTCPLCRFELPTDDQSYESWRERREHQV